MPPNDLPESDAAQRIMYERQFRQSTDRDVQILALQFQTGRCGDPDVLAGHDDPDLPLVTCSQDGKYVYLLDRALISGDQITAARAEYDNSMAADVGGHTGRRRRVGRQEILT